MEEENIQSEKEKEFLMDEPYNKTESVVSVSTNNKYLKPKHYKKLLNNLDTDSDLFFNYLSIIDLNKLRAVNKHFLKLVHSYFQRRIKIEIEMITEFQNHHQDKMNIFMKNIDSQIPISTNNWLNFDLGTVTNIMNSLSRDTLTQLRSIKNLGKMSDNIYAPFCIILGYNKSKDFKVKTDGWKKTAGKIISDSNFFIKINKLDFENLNDSDILEAFVYLNMPELNITSIKKYSPALAKMVKWCQAVVSYHILIHPYIFRNENAQIEKDGDVYKFALIMDYKINQFYKFKRFLSLLNLVKIPFGDYVFNLQHSLNRDNQEKKSDISKMLSVEIIGNILSFIPLKQSHKYMGVNKMFYKGFKYSLEKICLEILKEISFFKIQTYDKLKIKAPILFESNFFSKYFLMLDDILNSECSVKENGINYVPFISKEQLNDLKSLKLENDTINIICKILCCILGIKVQRMVNAKGEVKIKYMQTVKQMAINGSLIKMMRNLNKLELSPIQIKTLGENIFNFYSIDKLNEIKKMNRGLYQTTIWIIYIFEFLKEYNPLTFINYEVLLASSDFKKDEIDVINYFNELMAFLKYNLKAKFHFSSLNFEGLNKGPTYDLKNLIITISQFANENKLNSQIIFNACNEDNLKIASIYFNSKDMVPSSSKPTLYDRIMIEVITANNELYGDNNSNNLSNKTSLRQNDDNLGIIKEEAHQIDSTPMLNSPLNKSRDYQNAIKVSLNVKDNDIKNSRSIPPSLNISSNYRTIDLDGSKNNLNSKNIEEDPLIGKIPSMLFIKNILFYLDIPSLLKFSSANRKCNSCNKIHIYLRIFYLNKEIEMIEESNSELIEDIMNKRNQYYNDYEINPPNKDHANSLIKQFKKEDITELKQIFKKYNKNNETIISPLVYLLGEKPKITYRTDGTKNISFFTPAQKLICKKGFLKIIQKYEPETIPGTIFSKIEKLLEDQLFTPEKVRLFSPCIIHYISWILGIIEYHRTVRKFCLNSYDYQILDQNEISFCSHMDNLYFPYLKLLRYKDKNCKAYKRIAEDIMNNLE
ncbi:MAG: hypothetical protein MJ252_00510 [archaeon]|nr:hypothetical protein [archaeon]MCQ2815724.1 hypothetical protein [archaeon]